jgi:hypothetical protein
MKRCFPSVARVVACLVLAAAAVGALASVSVSSAASAVTTPTSGPLSKPPKIRIPAGPPSRKLVKIHLVKGTGALVAATDTVTINQVIARYNGKVLQSTFTSGRPLTEGLSLAQVIPGLIKGLAGARVCSRLELIIPAKLADEPPSKLPATRTTFIYVVDVLADQSLSGGSSHLCGSNSKP